MKLTIEKCEEKYFEQVLALGEKSAMIFENGKLTKLGISHKIEREDLKYIYIARIDDKVIASVKFLKIEDKDDKEWFEITDGEDAYTLEKTCVDEEYKGQGIMGKMVEYVKTLFDCGIIYIDIMNAPVENKSSKRAFEKSGFTFVFNKDWYNSEYNVDTTWSVYVLKVCK